MSIMIFVVIDGENAVDVPINCGDVSPFDLIVKCVKAVRYRLVEERRRLKDRVKWITSI